jgi:hypothetical protein
MEAIPDCTGSQLIRQKVSACDSQAVREAESFCLSLITDWAKTGIHHHSVIVCSTDALVLVRSDAQARLPLLSLVGCRDSNGARGGKVKPLRCKGFGDCAS